MGINMTLLVSISVLIDFNITSNNPKSIPRPSSGRYGHLPHTYTQSRFDVYYITYKMSSSITDIITSIANASSATSTSTSTSEVASSTTSYRQSGFGGPQLNPERPGQVGTMGMDRKPQSGEYGKGLPLYGQIIVFVMVGLMICGAVFGFWWFSRKWKKEAE